MSAHRWSCPDHKPICPTDCQWEPDYTKAQPDLPTRLRNRAEQIRTTETEDAS